MEKMDIGKYVVLCRLVTDVAQVNNIARNRVRNGNIKYILKFHLIMIRIFLMIGAPGVYTRVTEYLHWIYNTTHKKNKTKKQRRKNVTPSPAKLPATRLPSRPQREENQTPSPAKLPSTKAPSRPLRAQNQTPSIAKLPPSRVQPRPQRRQNQISSPARLPPVRVTPRPFVPQTAAPPQTVPPRTIPSRTVAPSIVGTTFN